MEFNIGIPKLLPIIREDLKLQEAPKNSHGHRTWTLYDPVRNKYYRLGVIEFCLLYCWGSRNASAVLKDASQKASAVITQQHLEKFVDFLDKNNLIEYEDNSSEVLQQKHDEQKIHILKRILSQYLFFRLKLFDPDKFLTKTQKFVEIFYKSYTLVTFFVIGLLGIFLAGREWEQFINTFMYFFNLKGLLFYAIALAVVKMIHELAHAYTAKRYGCPVNSMGIAFIIFWPVFFTDTTSAWRLVSRKQRLAIAGAGIVSECMIAAIALFLWSFVGDGIVRSMLFFLCTVSLLVTLVMNLNPFMKFDGYYLLSDFLNVHDMQRRSFAMARWRIREMVLGLNEPPPEYLPTALRAVLIKYAIGCWLYRVFVFTVIAMLLYVYVMKILGIALLIITLFTTILLPLWHETREYWHRRKLIKANRNTITALTTVLLVLGFVSIPWNNKVVLPSVIEYALDAKVYTNIPAKINQVSVYEGKYVNVGEVLFELKSPELDHNIQLIKNEMELLKWKKQREKGLTQEFGYRQTDQEELDRMRSRLDALLQKREKLTIVSPIKGRVISLQKGLEKNRWLAQNEELAEIVNKKAKRIIAYISEQDYKRIKLGDKAYFVPRNYEHGGKIKCKVVKIEEARSHELGEKYLASNHGGYLAVYQDEKGRNILKDTMYRVFLEPELKNKKFNHVIPGLVYINSESKSILRRSWVALSGVFIRESGF